MAPLMVAEPPDAKFKVMSGSVGVSQGKSQTEPSSFVSAPWTRPQ